MCATTTAARTLPFVAFVTASSFLAASGDYDAGGVGCTVQRGVEYLQPSHYKELTNVTSAAGCCEQCQREEGACGAWKLCTYSTGLSCRLLATAPTSTRLGDKCISGLPRLPAPSPSPSPSPPSPPAPPPRPCDVTHFGAKGDGITVDTAAINAAVGACDEVTFPVRRGSANVYVTGMLPPTARCRSHRACGKSPTMLC